MTHEPATPLPFDATGPCHHLHLAQGASRLVVFFGAKDLSFEQFNFFQTGRELPAHCLFLNNGVNHWYQYGVPGLGHDTQDTLDMIRRCRDALQAKEIMTIGTSMGGYGAISYGAHLGARVLAFSSDAKLAAPHSQSAAHFIPQGAPDCPDLCALLAQKPADITLFAGERDAPDLHAAWQLSQMPGVQAHSITGADHILPSHLARRARLVPLLRRFVLNTPLPPQLDAGEALKHPDYVTQTLAAYSAAQQADWTACVTAARAAGDVYSGGEAALALLGQALIGLGDFEQAVTALAPCVAACPQDTQTKMQLAQALRRCGARTQAALLYQQCVTQKPHLHRAWYALGIIALERGDHAGALSAVRKAVQLAPKIKAYTDRLTLLKRQP